MDNIQLDSIEDWPIRIKDELTTYHNELIEYFQIEEWIDEQSVENIEYRINRPYNKRSDVYYRLLRTINSEMMNKKIVGYHATRILPYEKANIQNKGLELLSINLVDKKLKFLLENDIVPQKVYLDLLEHNQAKAFNRKNQICLFHTKKTMQCEFGLSKLLGLYGGESIYWYHSRNPEITEYLKNIGKASIVNCSIKYSDNWSRYNINERMIKFFVERFNFEDFDSFHKEKVETNYIIDETDIEFEKLTNYSKWKSIT